MNTQRLTGTVVSFVLVTAAGGVQAQTSAAFCETARAIVAAARATPTWTGVARGDTGTAIPAPFRACSTSDYSSSADYTCGQDLTATTVTPAYERLVAGLVGCFGPITSTSQDGIATTHRWDAAADVQVSATRVVQANADHFAIGFGVRLSY